MSKQELDFLKQIRFLEIVNPKGAIVIKELIHVLSENKMEVVK